MVDAMNNYNNYNNYDNYEKYELNNEKSPLHTKSDSAHGGKEKLTNAEIRAKKRSGEIECKTCKSRKYVDGSDDPGVSFKTPQHINPSQSASAVMGHELEHYNRETASASKNGEEVVSASITLSRAICPECGRSYVSGGTTHVTKRVDTDKNKERDYFKDKFFNNTIGKYFPKKVDMKI